MTRIVYLLIAFAVGISDGWSQEISPELIVASLNNPCGIAIQPKTGDVFVAESGAGRIIKIEDRKIIEVIAEFPTQTFELDQELVIGPLGLAFRNQYELIVGGGGQSDEEEVVAMYNIREFEDDPTADPLEAKDMTLSLSLPKSGDQVAEGDFFALALSRGQLFVACNGDAKKGWLARAQWKDQQFTDLQRFIATHEKSKTPSPAAVTIGPENQLVVAQAGMRDTAADSILTFYNQQGQLLDKFPTGLSDVVALAYNPKQKKLFALDFSWHDPSQGGLYQLIAVDSAGGCVSKKIVALDRPTAMAFDPRGDLYITTAGLPSDGASGGPENNGKLFVIRGLK